MPMTAGRKHLRLSPAMRLAVNRRLVDGPLGAAYLQRRANMRSLLPTELSDVFIDGFPRSANSYAFYAFKVANPQAHVSGHCHSIDAIRRSLGYGVPTLILLREPKGCVASLVQFVPGLSVYAALGHYRRFHEGLLALGRGYFVASFEEVTHDLGRVIEAFNATMGTSFATYVKNDQNEARVEAVLQETNARYAGGGEGTSAVPSPYRLPTEEVMDRLNRPERRRLAECLELHALLRERK
jgi:hypothetical protein